MVRINQLISEARPKLSLIAPLTYAISWGFAVVNTVLGLGMILIYRGAVATIPVASILTYPQWGTVFLIIASIMAYGLVKNNWTLTRRSQLMGMLVKSIWLVALLVRCVNYPQTILITAVWLFLTYVQAVTYIHFIPEMRVGVGDRDV